MAAIRVLLLGIITTSPSGIRRLFYPETMLITARTLLSKCAAVIDPIPAAGRVPAPGPSARPTVPIVTPPPISAAGTSNQIHVLIASACADRSPDLAHNRVAPNVRRCQRRRRRYLWDSQTESSMIIPGSSRGNQLIQNFWTPRHVGIANRQNGYANRYLCLLRQGRTIWGLC